MVVNYSGFKNRKMKNLDREKNQLSRVNKKTGIKKFEKLEPYKQNTNIVKWKKNPYAFVVDWQISENEG